MGILHEVMFGVKHDNLSSLYPSLSKGYNTLSEAVKKIFSILNITRFRPEPQGEAPTQLAREGFSQEFEVNKRDPGKTRAVSYLDSTIPMNNNSFRFTGVLSEKDYRNINPFGFLNCSEVATRLFKQMLIGDNSQEKLSPLPKPSNFWVVCENFCKKLSEEEKESLSEVVRINLKNKKLDEINLIMENAGSGACGIVNLTYNNRVNRIFGKMFNVKFGHICNIATLNSGQVRLIDSYSRKYFDQTKNDQDRYLKKFGPEMDAVLVMTQDQWRKVQDRIALDFFVLAGMS